MSSKTVALLSVPVKTPDCHLAQVVTPYQQWRKPTTWCNSDNIAGEGGIQKAGMITPVKAHGCSTPHTPRKGWQHNNINSMTRHPVFSSARHFRQQGFSLIEIMVVVVIMGVLAALIVPNVMDRPDQARAVAARQDIGAIMQALKLYRLDHGRYPSSEQGLDALVVGKGKKAYMDRLPNDPWNTPYQYLNPGVHGDIDVFSLGADGKPGGEDVDADIGSWSN